MPDPGTRDRGRRRNRILLGILLLVGFALPEYDRSEGFLWVVQLVKSCPSPELRLLLVYPGLAGLVVLLVGAFAPWAGRALTVTGAGLVTFMILWVSHDQLAGTGPISGALMLWSRHLGVALVGLLAVGMLLAGSRARRRAPERGDPITVAVGGGVLILLSLLLPIGGENDTMMVIGVIRLFSAGDLASLGAIFLVSLALQIAAAVIVLATRDHRDDKAVRPAHVASWLLVAGMLVMISGGYVRVMALVEGDDLRRELLFQMLKWSSTGFGLTLLLPAGLSDLLTGRDAKPTA